MIITFSNNHKLTSHGAGFKFKWFHNIENRKCGNLGQWNGEVRREEGGHGTTRNLGWDRSIQYCPGAGPYHFPILFISKNIL